MRVEIDATELVSAQKILENFGDAARPIIAKAINRATRGIRTDAARQARSEYNIRARQVRGSFVVTPAKKNRLYAAAVSKGGAISLRHFNPQPSNPGRRPKAGVSVKVSRTRKKIPGSFVARMPNGTLGVFQRSGRSRLPIKKLYGPSVPQMLDHDNVLPKLQDGATSRFNKNLDHEIDYFLKQKGLR
jgi:hypothetical protein